MESVMQKKRMLENEQKRIVQICDRCNENTFIKEYDAEENKKIEQYEIENIGYVYALKEKDDFSKQLKAGDNIIISPTELKQITEEDFGEEDYFIEANNKIGYTTKIESGMWILSKQNEIRYTVKNDNKKIAVIQLKEIYKGTVEQKAFSYNSIVENLINDGLNKNDRILDVIENIILEEKIQKEVSENKSILGNKSLKLLVSEFELAVNCLEANELLGQNEESLEFKIQQINQKYEKLCMQLKIETENMKINIIEESAENRALILIEEENSLIKTIKEIAKAITRLLKSNVFERENSNVKIRR